MDDVFEIFRHDIKGKRLLKTGLTTTVLLGAAGVGKSVLFFLAALYQAQSYYTVYLRKTRVGLYMSVFITLPTENSSVRVWFTRKVLKDELEEGGIVNLRSEIRSFNDDRKGELDADHLYYFVDGPDHSHKKDDVLSVHDYLCTSGGHLLPKHEQQQYCMCTLSGWTKDEAVTGLWALHKIERETAERAYDLCGGCIRYILKACEDYDRTKGEIDFWLAVVYVKGVHLVSTERSESVKYFDRVCMTFRRNFEQRPIQIVDSRYMLHKLKERISLQTYFEGYRMGSTIVNGAPKGPYFELCIHKWFDETIPAPITKVCWSEGTGVEGVAELNAPNEYWIPSVSTFPNIDAVVVVGRKLYVLQITVIPGKKHNFNAEHFLEAFIAPVRNSFNRLEKDYLEKKVNVIVLVPLGSGETHWDLHDIISYITHEVDMTSKENFEKSMELLPFLDRGS